MKILFGFGEEIATMVQEISWYMLLALHGLGTGQFQSENTGAVSCQTEISNCGLGNFPQLMLRCHVVCGLDREQWSQHHEFVETNIGRTLPQTYTTVVAIQLFDTIRQVSENGE